MFLLSDLFCQPPRKGHPETNTPMRLRSVSRNGNASPASGWFLPSSKLCFRVKSLQRVFGCCPYFRLIRTNSCAFRSAGYPLPFSSRCQILWAFGFSRLLSAKDDEPLVQRPKLGQTRGEVQNPTREEMYGSEGVPLRI